MTALGATSSNNLATTLGRHANQKTVRTLAANHGRLIGAFHDQFPKSTDFGKLAIRQVKPLFVKTIS